MSKALALCSFAQYYVNKFSALFDTVRLSHNCRYDKFNATFRRLNHLRIFIASHIAYREEEKIMETKTRILIADANAEFCSLLTEYISNEKDFDVLGSAGDGIEALALIAELKPDILIMDLQLSQLDGLELLRRLPESKVKCKVVVLSGFINQNVLADCATLGVEYFIPNT